MDWKRGVGFGLIFIGMYIAITARVFTGAVVGFEPQNLISLLGAGVFIAGIFLVFVSGTLEKRIGESKKNIIIHGTEYESHAVERMEQRGLYPSVITDAIEHGDNYALKGVEDFGEAKGATQVYIKGKTADVAPGKSGFKWKDVGKEPRLKNVLVLTDSKGIVKTTYLRNDTEVDAFLKKYVNLQKKAA